MTFLKYSGHGRRPIVMIVGLWGLFRWGLGDEAASGRAGALVTGFLYDELLHHRLHHGRLPVRAFRILRGHHRIHHRFPDRNFGVIMTVWDWVFGTHYLSRRASPARGSTGRPPAASSDGSRS